jgi:Holliday junction resolvase
VGYGSGRRFEYRVRDIFRSAGWVVVRAAASKPVDLVCLKQGRAVLVECRYGSSRAWKADRERLASISSAAGAVPVVAEAGRRGPVRLARADTGEVFEP